MKFKNKKSLGQNFLIDKNILKKITDIGEISENDKVFENYRKRQWTNKNIIK